MITLNCASCNISFCLPNLVYERRLKDGEPFFCPNGHENVFEPSENETLKKQVDQLIRRVSVLKADNRYLHCRVKDLEADVKHYRGQASGYKGQWTLLKNRIEQEKVSVN